jgi:biopolymer transport protein ExbB
VAFFIERVLFFRRSLASDDDRIIAAVAAAKGRDAMHEALAAHRCDETAILLHVLDEQPESSASFKELLAAHLAVKRRHWERFSDFLGTVGSNAPFVGLLGTVLGIMKSFADLAVTTKGGPQAVMSGISEALIATAVGLAVAIPAIVFFNFCKARVRRSTILVEVLGAHLAAALWPKECER